MSRTMMAHCPLLNVWFESQERESLVSHLRFLLGLSQKGTLHLSNIAFSEEDERGDSGRHRTQHAGTG